MIDLPEPESDDFSRSTLLEDQRKRWRSGERTPVEAYLERRPKLGENENLVLDLIYNEVLLREELQEAPHADEYVRRFPQHAWGEDGRDGPAGGGAFVTMAGAIVGTPAYMAPEQARGDLSHVGTASDVWCLGATLYEMLSGHPPFRGDSPWETLEQLLRAEPQPLRQSAPNVPPVLEKICLKCLQKDQARRYADAEELADDLRAFLDGRATTVDRPSFWRRLFSWRRAKAGERPA